MRQLQQRTPGIGGKTIWMDLDGTLAEHSPDWKYEEFGKMLPTSLQLLKRLKAKGFRIFVYTSRTDTVTLLRGRAKVKDNIKKIRKWLQSQGLSPYIDGIWEKDKPLGVIIDDRAVQFDGNVDKILKQAMKMTDNWGLDDSEESIRKDCGEPIFLRIGRAFKAAFWVWWRTLTT